jgi:hypothetical protein
MMENGAGIYCDRCKDRIPLEDGAQVTIDYQNGTTLHYCELCSGQVRFTLEGRIRLFSKTILGWITGR